MPIVAFLDKYGLRMRYINLEASKLVMLQPQNIKLLMNFDKLLRSYIRLRYLCKKISTKLDLTTRKTRQKISARRKVYYHEYWSEVADAYGATLEDFGYGILQLSKGEQRTYVREYEVMLDDHLSLNMMGNKPLTHRMLMRGGYPVPQHLVFDLNSIDQAYDFQSKLKKQVVIKPTGGGAGSGVTTKIGNAKQLKNAALWASTFHAELMIEEQVQGASYRLLYLGGELIDTVRRDPPRVIGDGVSSIRALIDQENERRINSAKVTALSPIVIDMDCEKKLKEQLLNLGFVPEKEQVVIVKEVINQNTSQENYVIPESDIHPSTVAMGGEIASTFGLELIGLDVIVDDIGRPLQETGGVINEVNTTPGLHHHDLVANRACRTEVGEKVLRYVYAKNKAAGFPAKK